ncbi:DUF4276 family protein [bacterium]|nr:DUF4276 family protein [bacterium]
MKFIIIVEGKTERLAIQEFLKRWLDSKLNEKVGIKQRITIGGKLEDKFKKQAKKLLEEDRKKEILAVIGLLDLYGLGFDHKGTTKGVAKLFKDKKAAIENHVNHNQFRMFFAVHEFEAWLLSDPNVFQSNRRDELNKYSANPERVNFKNHPSKVIQDIYNKRKSKRSYKKTTDGCDLFSRLDPQVVYDKCPHFKMMLDEMVQMALAAGISLK